jgi:hypothetical protein
VFYWARELQRELRLPFFVNCLMTEDFEKMKNGFKKRKLSDDRRFKKDEK